MSIGKHQCWIWHHQQPTTLPFTPPRSSTTLLHHHQQHRFTTVANGCHQPWLSLPSTVTTHHHNGTPTTMTTRWQCHVTSAQRLNKHNTISTAHGNNDIAHHPDSDKVSRWAAPTPFLLVNYLTWQMAMTMWHVNKCGTSSDSDNPLSSLSTHEPKTTTTIHHHHE